MTIGRRHFFKIGGTAALITALPHKSSNAFIPAHNWDRYHFGSGPPVKDRLYQGPFPQYEPEAHFAGSDVVMVTTPSNDIVPNFGMGLVVYVSGDIGPPRIPGESLEKSIKDLVSIPFVQKIYMRPDWRQIQKRPGRLDFDDYWKITFDLAKTYHKSIAFRIMLENPDVPYYGVPDFLEEKIPYVRLKGKWRTGNDSIRSKKVHKMPRYDHPEYQAAFHELNAMLAEELNGHPLVEYMDTLMYGFWGEGHTWPFTGHPFPDDITAEKTWMDMFEVQQKYWTKTPLVTNTQPDWSRVGNAALLDRTVRSHNWIRTDTIFIENEQIEALANRPPWIAAVSEVGITPGDSPGLMAPEGQTRNDIIISHVEDIGANYWSVWNWHNIAAGNIMSYYQKYPESVDRIARRIGYRVRPSWIWHFQKQGHDGLVLGLVNDGIACVPGVLRITVCREDGSHVAGGSLDPGYPMTRGVHQALIMLPKGMDWKGLKLKAGLEVKGVLHPVTWACHQKLNTDGTLTLRPNL